MGVGIGLASVATPSYLSEVVLPVAWKRFEVFSVGESWPMLTE